MATASVSRNITIEDSNAQQQNDEATYYASLSVERRAACALEMVQEINERHERVYCVIAAAVDYRKGSPAAKWHDWSRQLNLPVQ